MFNVSRERTGEDGVDSVREQRKLEARKMPENDNDLLPEYDFSNAQRGRYAGRVSEAQMVSLDSDVAEVFPDSDSVNRALRSLVEIVRERERRAG